ncbi:MAG: hypothetical protein KDD60_09825 [Bdellovibrionales bacterium]|nr:hypothetical protein [Bdellovibrionales bacterium]
MTKDEEVNGPEIAAKILNAMEPERKDRIVQQIASAAPEIATKISDNLIRFDDIARLSGRGIQVLVQAVNHHDLIVSLKKAQPETLTAIFQNVSERKRALIEDDLKNEGPVKESEVLAAQKRILQILDDLERTGKILAEAPDESTSQSLKNVWV